MCVCVCVRARASVRACVLQTVLSLKFHKLKVLLEIIALSAKNRIIQLKRSLGSANYRISRPIRHTFFPPKNVNEIRPASYAPKVSIISKPINTCTSVIQHLYHEIVKFASKSWYLASLLVNGLLSYPGITHVILGICASAVAKCSQV